MVKGSFNSIIETLDFLKKQLMTYRKSNIELEFFLIDIRANELDLGKKNNLDEKNVFTGGLGIRVIKNNKIGYVSLSRINEESIQRGIDIAIKYSNYGKMIPNWQGLPSDSNFSEISGICDKDYLTDPIEKKGEFRVLRNELDNISKVFEFKVTSSFVQTFILNSNGLNANYKKTIFGLNLTYGRFDDRVLSEKMKYFETEYFVYTKYNELSKCVLENVESLVEQRKWNTLVQSKIKTPKKLSGELLLVPKISVSFIFSPIQRSLVTSPIPSKLEDHSSAKNQQIFSKKLSIIESGKQNSMVASTPFDTEGTPTTEKEIVKNGKFLDIKLHNIETASIFNTKPTGNAVRVLTAPPMVAASNMIVKSGNSSFDDLIAKIDRGIIAGGMQAYSLVLTNPWLVINGEIVKPLDDIRLSRDSMKNILKRVDAVGNVSKPFYIHTLESISWTGWIYPHILLRDMEFQTFTPLLTNN